MTRGSEIERGLEWWATLSRADKARWLQCAATPEEIDADLTSPDPHIRAAAGIASVGDAWIAFRTARRATSEAPSMTTVSTMGSSDLAHILAKSRDAAAGGINAMSTGEALAAALVLNRPDWLAAMNYTMAEALERIGPEWARLIPAAARQFTRDSEEAAYAAAEKARQARLAEIASRQTGDEMVNFSARLITCGNAPGYRDVSFTFDLKPIGNGAPIRASIRINPEDGETVVREIADVHRFAWRNGKPIDVKPDEQRPTWIDGPASRKT